MKYSFLVFLGAASYGILSTIAKLSYKAGFTAADATGSQMIFGVIILWAIVLIKEKGKTKTKTNKSDIVRLMLMGIPVGLTSVFYYQSVQLLPASIAILLLFQFTWIGILLEAISLKKLPSLAKVVSTVILMGGTVLASGVLENGLGGYNTKGIIYGLLASVSYALFIFFNGKSTSSISATKKSALMLTGAAILTVLVYPPVFLINGAVLNGLAIYGIPLALFGAVIPPLLFAIGIPKIGVGLSSIINAAELPVAVMASSVVLGEVVTSSQWTGVSIILAAMILPNLIERKINKKKVISELRN
ncbi:MAG: DMT family transporter [Bacteroidota bacterium]